MRALLLPIAVASCLASLSAAAAPLTLRIEGPSGAPNDASSAPAVSADGKAVAFVSSATNLLGADDNTPTQSKLFFYDVGSDTIVRVAPTANGNISAPSISRDGRYIAFHTNATNIQDPTSMDGESTDVIRFDRQALTNPFLRASVGFGNTKANAGSTSAAISGDGRYVAFASFATNLVSPASSGRAQIYVMDMNDRSVIMASRQPNGAEGDKDALALEPQALSNDGKRLVFTTQSKLIANVSAGNNWDVLVRTVDAQGTVSYQNVNRSAAGTLGEGSSDRGSISPNGRYVAFRSAASNLVPNVPNPFSTQYVRDLETNTVRLLPLPAGYQTCNRSRVADDGTALMQCQLATAPTHQQVFLVPPGGTPRLMSFAHNNAAAVGNDDSGNGLSLSADASLVAFESLASNLIPTDGNTATDVFVVAEPEVFDRIFRDGFE
jgi:Tol biopolymer transport system component